ncbi:MAG TPA: hypothetical protein VII63_00090 [Caulobacteraceae bacterium]
MRTILLIVLASIGLGGCALLFEAGALEGAEVGVAAGAETGAAEGLFASADITTSPDLSEGVAEDVASPTRRGELSNALYKMTDGGTRPAQWHVNRGGAISAAGQPMARIYSDGEVVGAGRKLGYFSAQDSLLYEYTSDGGTRKVAALKGFVTENGVKLVTREGGTLMRILRRDVAMDIIGMGDGQYLVRLADGTQAWLPSAAVATLALLAVPQLLFGCPTQDHEGAVVRKSGEIVRFKTCEERGNAYIVSDGESTTIIDAYDVETILTGDGIPGIQGDDASQAMVRNAQVAARAVGAAPGEEAMNVLHQTPFSPVLEGNPGQFQNASFAAPARRILPPGQAWTPAGQLPGAILQNGSAETVHGRLAYAPAFANAPRPSYPATVYGRNPAYGPYYGAPRPQGPYVRGTYSQPMYPRPQPIVRPPVYMSRPGYGGRGQGRLYGQP